MILIDFSQLAISTIMVEARGRTDIHVDVNLIRHMILNTIRAYKVKHHAKFGTPVICCDGRKYWRKKEFPFYKAGRKQARQDSGLDWEELFKALNQVKLELAEFFPYPVIEVEGAEADDVIAALVLWTQTNDLVQTDSLFDDGEPQPVLILSGDHDFMQLQRYPNVAQFAPIQKAWVKIKEPVDHILMEHILRGDKGDGVPNFLSPDNTFVEGTRQKPIKTADLDRWKRMTREQLFQKFTDSEKAGFDRNAKLVDLRNVPEELAQQVIHSYTTQKGLRDKSQLLNYFVRNKMRNMIDCLGEF